MSSNHWDMMRSLGGFISDKYWIQTEVARCYQLIIWVCLKTWIPKSTGEANFEVYISRHTHVAKRIRSCSSGSTIPFTNCVQRRKRSCSSEQIWGFATCLKWADKFKGLVSVTFSIQVDNSGINMLKSTKRWMQWCEETLAYLNMGWIHTAKYANI